MTFRSWSAEVRNLGDRIAGLTVARAAELTDYLEAAHGIRSVSPSVVVQPRHDRKEEREEPAEPAGFDVVLDGYDAARKVGVIKAVREAGVLGLKEAKDLVESAPVIVKERLPRAEAEQLRARLEASGAKATLRACPA